MKVVADFPSDEGCRRILVGSAMSLPFRSLRSYLKYASFFVEEAERKLEDEVKKLTSKDTIDECLYEELDIHERFDVNSEFLTIQYKSIAILVYSEFEKSMTYLCESARQPTALKWQHMSGKGVWKCKNFLEGVCHVSSAFETDAWRSITVINEVRNLLVHQYGWIPSEKKKRFDSCPGLTFKPDDDGAGFYFSIDREFCDFCIENCVQVCIDVLGEIKV